MTFRRFRELFILHKNNTMAVLLKTASVWVSSIQIMQVRVQNKGKRVWKSRYVGDVSAILREATSETYGPGSIFYHINLPSTIYLYFTFVLQSLLSIYNKIPKILSYDLYQISLFASGREGIDNPFIALVARFLFFCVGTRDSHVVSYWIDTLVLKN